MRWTAFSLGDHRSRYFELFQISLTGISSVETQTFPKGLGPVAERNSEAGCVSVLRSFGSHALHILLSVSRVDAAYFVTQASTGSYLTATRVTSLWSSLLDKTSELFSCTHWIYFQHVQRFLDKTQCKAFQRQVASLKPCSH